MSAHTPGPWIAENNDGYGALTIWSKMTPTGGGTPGPMIATVVGDNAEADANGCLMAAAPDLLAALQACLDYGSMTGDEWVVDRAIAAIAKATGGA